MDLRFVRATLSQLSYVGLAPNLTLPDPTVPYHTLPCRALPDQTVPHQMKTCQDSVIVT